MVEWLIIYSLQWFGNLVTMKWWNDLWLNEGFASYVEWIGTDAAQPKWHYLDFQTYTDRTSALSIDSYTSSRPTSVDVEEPADITAQFDSISYSKVPTLQNCFFECRQGNSKTPKFTIFAMPLYQFQPLTSGKSGSPHLHF